MFLLYLDESGNPDSAEDRHFVLAGLAVHEMKIHSLSRELDRLQDRMLPNRPPIEFHASSIRSGKGIWRDVPKDTRDKLIESLVDVIERQERGVALFASVIEKDGSKYGESAVKDATEQVTKRFDIFLRRQLAEKRSNQRGLLVFAEGRYHDRARIWVKGFRDLGTKWGVVNNLSDIAYFASTRESRLLQLADLVAHSLYLAYEKQELALAKRLLPKFDHKDGVVHGISHYTYDRSCRCAACASRRNAHDIGTWS